jgi:hypothetical protein
MRPIQGGDIRRGACSGVDTGHPGWVSADFNGDGIRDYGLLLISSKPSRTVRFDGKDYPVFSARVTAFLGLAGNRFEERSIYEFDEALPTIRGIRLQMPETAADPGARRYLTWRYPALVFFACGQFEVAYFWFDKGFRPARLTE